MKYSPALADVRDTTQVLEAFHSGSAQWSGSLGMTDNAALDFPLAVSVESEPSLAGRAGERRLWKTGLAVAGTCSAGRVQSIRGQGVLRVSPAGWPNSCLEFC